MLGLDIGTGHVVCARQDDSSNTQIKSIRDAFIDVENDQSHKNMFKMSGVSFFEEDDTLYIIGDAALTVANLLKREVRRPLSQGVISPGETESEKILITLLKQLVGSPKLEDEIVYYSIPANPIDRDMDVVYHSAMFKKILTSFGYNPKPMNEAAAIVYSNCAEEQFTALASSFGSGMINTALVFQTMIGMSFSLSQSGDYIDQSAAKATNSTASRIMSIKEKGVDLLDPTKGDLKYLREREAIVVYYKNLIHNVIDAIKKEFKRSSSSIELPDSIPWVLSGGTSKPINFLEFFKQEFEKVRKGFPINISEIRLSKDQLNDVAKGLLLAAMND